MGGNGPGMTALIIIGIIQITLLAFLVFMVYAIGEGMAGKDK